MVQARVEGSGAAVRQAYVRPVSVTVAVNELGRRIGESHHNAVISDALVDEMRARHEDDGLGYRKISREFKVALTTVRKICTYERRAQTAERWKVIRQRKARQPGSPPAWTLIREPAGVGLFDADGVAFNIQDIPATLRLRRSAGSLTRTA